MKWLASKLVTLSAAKRNGMWCITRARYTGYQAGQILSTAFANALQTRPSKTLWGDAPFPSPALPALHPTFDGSIQ